MYASSSSPSSFCNHIQLSPANLTTLLQFSVLWAYSISESNLKLQSVEISLAHKPFKISLHQCLKIYTAFQSNNKSITSCLLIYKTSNQKHICTLNQQHIFKLVFLFHHNDLILYISFPSHSVSFELQVSRCLLTNRFPKHARHLTFTFAHSVTFDLSSPLRLARQLLQR